MPAKRPIRFTADIDVMPVAKKFEDLEFDDYFTIPGTHGMSGFDLGIPVWRKCELFDKGLGGANLLDGAERVFSPDDDVILVRIRNIRKAKG